MFGKYAVYIIPSYGLTVLVIGVLVLWIMIVHRSRKNEIAALQAKGITRGSSNKTDTEGAVR